MVKKTYKLKVVALTYHSQILHFIHFFGSVQLGILLNNQALINNV